MDKKVKISGIISAILGVVSFSWLIYDFIALDYIKSKMINLQPLGRLGETLGGFVWIGFLLIFLFHVSSFIALLFQFQYHKKVNVLRIILLFIGILSLFAMMGDYAMLNDIGKEYKMGLETQGEWIILYLLLLLHGFFHILMFIMIFHTFRHPPNQKRPEFVLKDEIIFIVAQYIGIFCGVMGLWTNFSYIRRQMASEQLLYLIPFYCLILIPYGLTVLYWLLMRLRDNPTDWYDEKQWRDISKAGLMTLLLSIPGLALLFLSSQPIGPYWFPHYLFMILFLFSGSTLFLSKKT